MIIGSISEDKKFEKRISITPEIAKKYISNGFELIIETDLGSHLGIKDEHFVKEGCKIENRDNVLKKSDIILQLNLPNSNSIDLIKENNILIGNFNSSLNKDLITKISNNKRYQFSLWSSYQESLELNQWIFYHLRQIWQDIKL